MKIDPAPENTPINPEPINPLPTPSEEPVQEFFEKKNSNEYKLIDNFFKETAKDTSEPEISEAQCRSHAKIMASVESSTYYSILGYELSKEQRKYLEIILGLKYFQEQKLPKIHANTFLWSMRASYIADYAAKKHKKNIHEIVINFFKKKGSTKTAFQKIKAFFKRKPPEQPTEPPLEPPEPLENPK